MQNFLKMGKKWSDISKIMTNRTENAVKNRWKSLIKKHAHEFKGKSSSAKSLDSEDANEDAHRQIAGLIVNRQGSGAMSKIEENDENGQDSKSESSELSDSEKNIKKSQSYANSDLKGSKTKSDLDVKLKKNILMDLAAGDKAKSQTLDRKLQNNIVPNLPTQNVAQNWFLNPSK